MFLGTRFCHCQCRYCCALRIGPGPGPQFEIEIHFMPSTLENSVGMAETSLRNEEEDNNGDKREIGADAVWTLSTAKPGNGVEQLRYVCTNLRSTS